ncbi:hypothetical protein V2J09_022739 [Rumex salicifolius]
MDYMWDRNTSFFYMSITPMFWKHMPEITFVPCIPWLIFHPRTCFTSLPPFSAGNEERAIRDIGSIKALGIDGYQPLFYQKSWPTVGKSLVDLVLDFFKNPQLELAANEILLILISITIKPSLIEQFRPISVCNVYYKSITKVLMNRLKPMITDLVSPIQSSFIPGRLISDNVVLVQ